MSVPWALSCQFISSCSLLYTIFKFFYDFQIEEARNIVSETSAKMFNSVSNAHERSKVLDKSLKDLTKEAQILSREKEAIEKQRTEAIKKRAKLELDDRDLQEKIHGNIKAKVLLKLESY